MRLRPQDIATDRAPWHPAPAALPSVRSECRGLHLTMRDGVRIALDVHLPLQRSATAGLPTMVRQTRYFRGVRWREPFSRLPMEFLLDHAADTRKRFLAAGYAWVDVCARGSGASFGSRPFPWSDDETADGGEVVDWIVAQPWSNGRVGSTGVSYDGTSADFLLRNKRAAVKAIAPRFSLFDTYTDVAFPGGIHLAWFTEQWSSFNRALDANALDDAFARMLRVQLRALRGQASGPLKAWLEWLIGRGDSADGEALARRLVRRMAHGVRPVDDDDTEHLLRDAVAEHADNFDVHRAALGIEFRDDDNVHGDYPNATIDHFSPHRYAEEMRDSGAAILGYSGWLDAAYQHGAMKRFGAVPTAGSKLIIGPWDHGGLQNISPHGRQRRSAFDQDGELVRFFDHHLKRVDNGVADDPPVRYFSIGEERWKSAATWPPPEARQQAWYLGPERRLAPDEPNGSEGIDEYRVDHALGTGFRSRWVSLLGLLPPVGYDDRGPLGRRMLVYRSAPLDAHVDIAGHPVLVIHLAVDCEDAHVFAYLEDERVDGRVDYVTEGQLRAIHRPQDSGDGALPSAGVARSFARADARPLEPNRVTELRFDLLPIAWRFARGHRLRLAIAGTDADHFMAAPQNHMAVHRSARHPSRLELPIMPS